MAQVITASIPFGTKLLGDGTGGTVTSAILGGVLNGQELRSVGSAYFHVSGSVTITLERTFQNPGDPDAVWTTIEAGITNRDYYYAGPLVSGLRFTRTGGSDSIVGTFSEFPGIVGGSDSPAIVQGVSPDETPASGNPVRVGGVYNATPVTYTDGDQTSLQGDVNGFLMVHEAYRPGYENNTNDVAQVAPLPLGGVSTFSWSIFTNFGANATLNVKSTAANLYSIYCHNLNGAARYIQMHNTATTPGGGAVPILTYLVPANGTVTIDAKSLGELGDSFSTGLAFAFSTTEGTYTAGTASDQFTIIHYK